LRGERRGVLQPFGMVATPAGQNAKRPVVAAGRRGPDRSGRGPKPPALRLVGGDVKRRLAKDLSQRFGVEVHEAHVLANGRRERRRLLGPESGREAAHMAQSDDDEDLGRPGVGERADVKGHRGFAARVLRVGRAGRPTNGLEIRREADAGDRVGVGERIAMVGVAVDVQVGAS